MPIHRINTVKRKNHKIVVSPEQKQYDKMITGINNNLDKLNSLEYIKFRDYNTELLTQLGDEFKRKHFKDRSQFKLMKGNRIGFMYQTFFEPTDKIKILLKLDNFKYISKTFTKEGVEILNKIFMNVDSSLINRKYDPIDTNIVYNEITFNESLKVLGLMIGVKIKFGEIKTKYNEKKEFAGGNMELKNKFNKAYILIRDQYADYLNNV